MPTSNQTSAVPRLDQLDAIRGVAAFFVFFSHYMSAFHMSPSGAPFLPKWLDSGPLAFFQDGFAAVTIFLVLSGYVLSLRFWRKGTQEIRKNIPKFYLGRILRIFPPFLAALAFSAAIYHWKIPNEVDLPLRSGWYRAHWNLPISWEAFFRQVFLFVPTVSDSSRWIPMDWTLSVELNISFLIPFLIIIASIVDWYLLVFAVFSIFLLKMHGFLIHFSLGILLAQNQSQISAMWNRFSRFKKWGWLGIAFFLYTTRTWIHGVPYWQLLKESWLWYITGFGAFLFLVSATSSLTMRRLLVARPLVFLGKISYSVYLLHFPIVLGIAPYVLKLIPQSSSLMFLLGLLANSVIVVFVSAVSYFLVERPSMILASKLSR